MSARELAKFEYELLIREHHLDTFGHVNNATYVSLFEEARWELIEARGFGLQKIQASGLGPVILGLQLEFRKEIKNREKIKIVTSCESYRGKVGYLTQMMHKANGELACRAQFTFGLFDTRARKLIPPTPEWLQAIGFDGDITS